MSTQEVLRVENVYKNYGIKPILHDLHLSLNRGERAALVGENGAGKTTLARLLIGAESMDQGKMQLAPGATLGYLPQEVVTDDAALTIRAYVEQALGALHALRDEMRQLEAQMSQPDADMDALLMRYGDVQEVFMQRGGYELDHRMAQVFEGLDIAYLDQERAMPSLSGGEKTRVALAALLLRAPDLLILDEPTNHLDFAGIEWLEQYLHNYPHALLLITHDRRFINRVVNQIIELSPVTRNLTVYHGDYDAYLQAREREYQQQVAAYNAQQNERKRLEREIKMQTHNTPKSAPKPEGDKFIRFYKNQQAAHTVRKTIRSAQQDLADLEANTMRNPRHEWTVRFDFDPEPLGSNEPVRFEDVRKAFGDNVVLDAVSARVLNGERVVIVAPNGAGKTTLLRILMGDIAPDGGAVHIAPSAKIGYLDQEAGTLDFSRTVLDAFREVARGDDKVLQAQIHRSGLFTDATLLHKRVADLSVGMRRKLAVARIIAARANVLLMDEPTNHLDFMSIEALENALLHFSGTMLAVSHDRRFIEKVATQVWHLEGGKLRVN